eukprot:TRINITY_DN4171_c0_g1_i1.p1 TRINITY_DN4171_c0_g1~~TRINITY_DN4171_c0_g1_i1.p1  ORF type:complete len:461 (-),score=82.93 TRINITY_DN4171_c0_g1_i1:11-1393(-)
MKLFILTFLFLTTAFAQYTPDWSSLDARPLPSWYDEAKFGLLITWGIWSVPSYGCGGEPNAPGAEWYWWYLDGARVKCLQEFHNSTYGPDFTYPEFAPQFTATLFDPDDWAKLFAASGARYVVFITKHHDGFTSWKSPQSWNWNSVDTGPHLDLVDMVTKAVRDAGLRMGLYHSLYEWFNPLYLKDRDDNGSTQIYVDQVLQPMLYELVNTYKPEIVWGDGDTDMNSTYWKSKEFLAWLYNESPVKDTVLVNDRWGSECACAHGGFWTCDDNYNPGHLLPHKWENVLNMDYISWGYNRATNITGYHTIEELITELVTTVSCGGNLMLNVAPASDGTIHPIFQERLLQIGSWLDVNGNAIYKTVPWREQNDTDSQVWYTAANNTKGSTIYATTLSWPADNVLVLTRPIYLDSTATFTMLGYGELTWSYEQTSGEWKIDMPVIPVSKLPCQWAWSIQIDGVL